MSSHSSCPGVENTPNFGPEKMVHVAHAPSLSACLVRTVTCLLVWQMHSFQDVLMWLQVMWQSMLWVLSRKFLNALTSQLSQIRECCLVRSLCRMLSSCCVGYVTISGQLLQELYGYIVEKGPGGSASMHLLSGWARHRLSSSVCSYPKLATQWNSASKQKHRLHRDVLSKGGHPHIWPRMIIMELRISYHLVTL